MQSFRNSRFIENFDDDESESDSAESLSTAPSPEHREPESTSSMNLASLFSGMRLRHNATHGDGSQAQARVEARGSIQNEEQQVADVKMLPEGPTTVIDNKPAVAQESTLNVPRNEETTPQAQVRDEEQVTTSINKLSKEPDASIDDHQSGKPRVAVSTGKGKARESHPEHDTPQHNHHNTTQEPSTKTTNSFLHQLFDEILREQSVTPEELDHASKYIKANFARLEQDLECFAAYRLELQEEFASHERVDTLLGSDCSTCEAIVDKLDASYSKIWADVRDMMEVLEKGMRVSILLFKNSHKHVSDHTPTLILGQLSAPLWQKLEATKRMLQSLMDDAEDGNGWAQISMLRWHYSTSGQSADGHDCKSRSKDNGVETKADKKSSVIAISLQEFLEVFGDESRSLTYFQTHVGTENGQVKFALHPNGDISAQQWMQLDHQWFELGRLTNSGTLLEGGLASYGLKDRNQLHPLLQNGLCYFKAVARYHDARTMDLPFGPEELQACMPESFIESFARGVATTTSASGAQIRSEDEPHGSEQANEGENARVDGAKSDQVKGRKGKSKKQKNKKKKKGKR